MKIFLKTVLLGCILLLAFILTAQVQDYVITLKGDTIPCKISGDTKFKCDNPADLARIKQSRVSYFYVAKKKRLQRVVFKSNYGDDWMLDLMTVVENGKISLYQSIDINPPNFDGSSNQATVWYVGKGTDSVRSLKSSGTYVNTSRQSRKDELGELFMDNKEVYDKYVADNKFTFKQIRNLVHLYNTGQPLKD